MDSDEVLLAVDPSLRGTGFAVLQRSAGRVRCLHFDVIKNAPKLTVAGCLLQIHTRLTDTIVRFQPSAMAVESVIYVQSFPTAITLGSARGAVLLAAAQRGLPIHEYAPRRVKQAVVGTGTAQKTQVAFMVRTLLGLTVTPRRMPPTPSLWDLLIFRQTKSPLALLFIAHENPPSRSTHIRSCSRSPRGSRWAVATRRNGGSAHSLGT